MDARAVRALLRRARGRDDAATRLRLDILLAVVLMVASALPLFGWGATNCRCPAVPTWAYFAVAAQTLPLAARRISPFAVALFIAPFAVIYGLSELPDPPVPYGALVSIYSVSAYSSRLKSYLTIVMVAAVLLLMPIFSAGNSDVLDYSNNALVFAGSWLLGDSVRNRRAYILATEERARHAEAEQVERAQHAAAEERTRIAREMHDVLAHSMSLVIIQAEAGPVVVHTEPQRAIEMFDQIAKTGRHALMDLRRLLGLLREQGSASDRTPQPNIESIAALVEQAVQTGMDVQLEVEGAAFEVSDGTGLTAYRVVQEGLTNAARHAATARVRVLLRYESGGLLIDVADDAVGVPVGQGPGASSFPGAGFGLAGLQERVEAADGRLQAGPSTSGGWLLSARLPVSTTTTDGRR